jgi:hypothetical protein
MDIVNAIVSLRPNAQWNLNGDEYSGLEWLDQNQTKPTEEELQVELTRLREEYETKEYQRNRAKEYPSFADQFDLLYHGGYDVWKQTIDAIKDKYPKV